MKARSPLRLSLIALAVVSLATAYGIVERPRLTSTTSPSPAEIDPTPFDAVLSEPAPEARFAPNQNVVVNDPADEPVYVAQSEVAIAISGDKVVLGWNDGSAFVDPAGDQVSGFGYSTDRGESWTDGGDMKGTSTMFVFGDPSIASTSSGDWIYASVDLGTPNGLAIHRGRFDEDAPAWETPDKFTDENHFLDKPWLRFDESIGRLYMAYADISDSAGRLTYSDDSGATWETPLTAISGESPNGFFPAPGIDGEVYVVWNAPVDTPAGGIFIRHSSDGGSSWSGSDFQVHAYGSEAHLPPACFNRGNNINYAQVGVDRSDGPYRGRIYVTYSDGSPGTFDAFLTYSDDKGRSWSPPLRMNDNVNSSEQFWPQVHVGPYGRVTAGWYDRRKAIGGSSIADFYVAQSIDGGESVGPNRRASDRSVPWCNVPSNMSPNFGDYVALISDQRSVFASWSDARNGGPDVIFGRIDDRYAVSVLGTITDEESPDLVEVEAEGTAWLMNNVAEFESSPAPTVDSPAEILIPALAIGLLSSPRESDGLFQISEGFSGEWTLGSTEGPVSGSFDVGAIDGEMSLGFDARSGGGVLDLETTGSWSADLEIFQSLPSSATVTGVTILETTVGPIEFDVYGELELEPGSTFFFPLDVRILGELRPGDASRGAEPLFVRTTSTVSRGAPVDVETYDPIPGIGRPHPTATIRATPNPLDVATEIRMTLSESANTEVSIYSTEGRRVRRIFEGRLQAGAHSIPFDGKDDSGRDLPRGGYFLRLETPNIQVGGKLFVIH